MIDLVVVGCGGLGREVLDVIEAINGHKPVAEYNVLGVIDDDPSDASLARLAARGYDYLGTTDNWLKMPSTVQVVIGVGTPRARKHLAEKFQRANISSPVLIHPTAVIGSKVSFEVGSIICAGVHITTNVKVKQHSLLNLLVTVGHDTVIGEYCVINPTANISGEVLLGDTVLVGTGAQVLQEITIGSGATVGASACVTKDVPEGVVAVGIPAKWKQ